MTLQESKKFADWVAGRFIIGMLVVLAIHALPFWRDDTDTAGHRSGLRPRTDARTGCQYLETSGGGITPRLDSSGHQVGCVN
jgi:hypothetical protein